jgi:hypothetical protein
MFKLENIIVTNGTTHCRLTQGSKIIFQSNTSIEFTKVSCTFMRNKELRLLDIEFIKEDFFKYIFICIYIIVTMCNVSYYMSHRLHALVSVTKYI